MRPSRVVAAVLEPAQLQRARQPRPLRGTALGRRTGLRLVVAAVPPFLLDVDTGRVTPVRGVLPAQPEALWVVGGGGNAAALVAESAPNHKLYAVNGSSSRAAPLGPGKMVWPSADGRSFWVQSLIERSRCTLRQVAPSGRVIRAGRPFPCASITDPVAGSLGLVVNRTRVIDPLTGKTARETPFGILAVAGHSLVLAGPNRQFTLMDAETGARRLLPWTSIVSELDRPAADPTGRFVALAFGDPAWKFGARQALDVWLLDTETGALTQVPGMPAFVSLKETSMVWTRNGRLVLLAESGGRNVVAVWRPGQRRLGIKIVRLPNRSQSGSDSFASIR